MNEWKMPFVKKSAKKTTLWFILDKYKCLSLKKIHIILYVHYTFCSPNVQKVLMHCLLVDIWKICFWKFTLDCYPIYAKAHRLD